MDHFTEFTPYRGLIGGALIGVSAVLFLWINGRIAGISGLVHGLLPPKEKIEFWRVTFLIGLVVGGFSYFLFPVIQFPLRQHFYISFLLLGGFLVGFGSRIGQGCTSGHGVCGIARISKRSFVATFTFLISAMVTVFLLRHVLGVS
ncbi:YeeE/YedE family protein [Legionella impletisoli]|uniref:Membrane protein n=1 Tax=Legionella impletisoli TaxID=343510 RepID=A0A917JTT5_9GAMM|nr:YeeE/YedE family protein [Legionella impletisoli]GGI81894.1 membrane protein [Legionella impletisoli]